MVKCKLRDNDLKVCRCFFQSGSASFSSFSVNWETEKKMDDIMIFSFCCCLKGGVKKTFSFHVLSSSSTGDQLRIPDVSLFTSWLWMQCRWLKSGAEKLSSPTAMSEPCILCSRREEERITKNRKLRGKKREPQDINPREANGIPYKLVMSFNGRRMKRDQKKENLEFSKENFIQLP